MLLSFELGITRFEVLSWREIVDSQRPRPSPPRMSAILACADKDPPVPTYSEEDFGRIAKAINKSMADVLEHENEFEEAATWYRLDTTPAKKDEASNLELRKQPSEKPKRLSNLRKQRSPKLKTPSELRRKAKRVEAAARKLLRHLGVYHCREALDGPGDRDLLIFLASYSGRAEEEVTRAIARAGRLAELFEGIDAAKFLEVCADKAAQEAIYFAKLLPERHHGDTAAIKWIAAMMSLYKRITGREPCISILRPGSGRGQPAGPFLRFLEASAEPLKIKLKPASSRSRIRALKRIADRRQK